MAFISRPNSWVSQEAPATTQFTYALQLNPAPLTVSIAGSDPVLGSLEFVITNPTASAISVNSIAFTIQVGTDSSDLTTSTATVGTSVSDTVNWLIQSPGTVTSGPAVYTLLPQTGTSVSVASGASIIVQIYNFPTVGSPGNTTINIKETAGSISFTSFLVTTFPSGFYFNGLIATVQSGSQYLPVAQVANPATVILVWNSSVVDLGSFTIYYSNAALGQQQATPSDTGISSPIEVTCDTVFTLVVTVSVAGGAPLTAALSTSVSVQNPSLIAASVTAATAIVSGPFAVAGQSNLGPLNVDGSVGIGTATPIATLDVANGVLHVGGQVYPDTAGQGAYLGWNVLSGGTGETDFINNQGDGTGGFAFMNTPKSGSPMSTLMFIDGNGNVGIGTGTASPNSKLDINGQLNVASGATIGSYILLHSAQDQSRNVMLSVANTVANQYGILVQSSAPQGFIWALYVQGGGCINTSGSWSQFSDLTLKDGVEPYTDSLAQVLKINPIRYHYKEETKLGAGDHVGVAAQDLQQIAPYMVGASKLNPDCEEEYLTIDNGPLTYMLINAVKELHAEIEALKAKSKTKKSK